MADIKGTANADTLLGTTLQDLMLGLGGNDSLDGNDGDDDIQGSGGNDSLFGGAGNDLLSGGSGDDMLFDGAGNDTVNGGAGDDFVMAGDGGDDLFMGGSGADTIDYSNALNGLTVDLSKNIVSGDGADTVQGFETFVGSSFDDQIKGSSLTETINGGDGDDVIRSLGGSDVLTGGEGSDRFVFNMKDVVDSTGALLGIDVVKDFQNNDVIDLRGMLPSDAGSRIDEFVTLLDTDAGTMVQVNTGTSVFDVVLLEGVHTGGALASDWASDHLLLPEPPLLA